MSLSKTYRAALMRAPADPLLPIEIVDLPAPDLEPGAVLLHTLYSEVCGTDVHLRHGKLAGVPYPIIPGHVSVGVVAAARGPVADVDGRPFREGDVATFLDVHGTCGACYYCLVARESTRCPSRKVYGITYGLDDGLTGGWAEAIHLKPGTRLIRLPEGLSPEVYVAGGCGMVTALHAVDRAEIRLGDTVAVLGAGPVGQGIVAYAALAGASEVVCIGAPADRLAFARKMGATATFDLSVPTAERLEKVRALTGGRGADKVIEASGAPDAVSQGLDLLRDGGRMVVSGHYTDNGPVSVHPHHQINKKHVEVRGCWGSDFSHFYRAAALCARTQDRVPWAEMATRRFPIDRATEALDAVEQRAVLKALIVPKA